MNRIVGFSLLRGRDAFEATEAPDDSPYILHGSRQTCMGAAAWLARGGAWQQSGNSRLLVSSAAPGFIVQNKDVSLTSRLNPGDIKLKQYLQEKAGGRIQKVILWDFSTFLFFTRNYATYFSCYVPRWGNLQTKTDKSESKHMPQWCRRSAIGPQQEAALRNDFTQGCCSIMLKRQANQSITMSCLLLCLNPFRLNCIPEVQ